MLVVEVAPHLTAADDATRLRAGIGTARCRLEGRVTDNAQALGLDDLDRRQFMHAMPLVARRTQGYQVAQFMLPTHAVRHDVVDVQCLPVLLRGLTALLANLVPSPNCLASGSPAPAVGIAASATPRRTSFANTVSLHVGAIQEELAAFRVSNTEGSRLELRAATAGTRYERASFQWVGSGIMRWHRDLHNRSDVGGRLGLQSRRLPLFYRTSGPDWEDGVPRVVTSCVDRTHKLKALGNALVPQVALQIFQALEVNSDLP